MQSVVNGIRVLIISIIVLLSHHVLMAQDSLRILTWNIQMLPGVAKTGGKAKRSNAIVNQLKERSYDVIIFQELFHKRSRSIITEGLANQYPHYTDILNKKTFALKSNGGVMIFSKFPIVKTAKIRFAKRKGFDRMARKGAILAELNVQGKSMQVVGTHLQAFGTQEVLYSQYHQLASELLQRHSKDGVPQILCGDFNTLKTLPPQIPDNITQDFIDRLPRYQYMLHTLDAQDGELLGEQQYTMDRPYNDLCKTRKEFRLLLDYVLLRPNGINNFSLKRSVKIMRQSWKKEHQDLSDHFGLEAVLSGF